MALISRPNGPPKVLLLTSLPSPFHLDVAEEINRSDIIDFHCLFSDSESTSRGGHWFKDPRLSDPRKFTLPSKTTHSQGFSSLDILERITDLAPDLVIIGTYSVISIREVIPLFQKNRIPHGFWIEPPNFLRNRFILELYLQTALRRRFSSARFIWGIGDRALSVYGRVFKGQKVLIPYGESLTGAHELGVSFKSKPRPLTLLFSGALVKRHNLPLIAEALGALHSKLPGDWRFILAAKGAEGSAFWQIIDQHAGLRERIRVDVDYKNWEDRLRPMGESDLLLYPSAHSGWGLVIPESMAAGCIPISTTNVEAARYYVQHGQNGYLVEAEVGAIVETVMKYAVLSQDEKNKLRERAIQSAWKGDATSVAKEITENVLAQISP